MQAANADGGSATGSVQTFTTSSSVGAPSNAVATVSGNDIILSWVKGTGATDTIIRYAVGVIPADNVSGALLYNSTASTVTQPNVTQGSTYGYRLFGYDPSEGWSSTSITVSITPGSSENSTGSGYLPSGMSLPSGFLADPDATGMSGFLFDPIMKQNSAEVGMPLNWAYAGACMVISGLFGAIGWWFSKKPVIALVIFTLGLLVGNQMSIMPGFVIWILVVIDGLLIFLEFRKVG